MIFKKRGKQATDSFLSFLEILLELGTGEIHMGLPQQFFIPIWMKILLASHFSENWVPKWPWREYWLAFYHLFTEKEACESSLHKVKTGNNKNHQEHVSKNFRYWIIPVARTKLTKAEAHQLSKTITRYYTTSHNTDQECVAALNVKF